MKMPSLSPTSRDKFSIEPESMTARQVMTGFLLTHKIIDYKLGAMKTTHNVTATTQTAIIHKLNSSKGANV